MPFSTGNKLLDDILSFVAENFQRVGESAAQNTEASGRLLQGDLRPEQLGPLMRSVIGMNPAVAGVTFNKFASAQKGTNLLEQIFQEGVNTQKSFGSEPWNRDSFMEYILGNIASALEKVPAGIDRGASGISGIRRLVAPISHQANMYTKPISPADTLATLTPLQKAGIFSPDVMSRIGSEWKNQSGLSNDLGSYQLDQSALGRVIRFLDEAK